MPGEGLTDAGFVGLFGKLPATGDFVARGLPDAFRARWDAWVTRHLARREDPLPGDGLRFRLRSGSRTASGLVLASRDLAGRRFPLSGLLVLPFVPAVTEADLWCDAALPLLEAATTGGVDANSLWHRLEALPRPAAVGDAEEGPLLLWAVGAEPRAADPTDPGPALDGILSSRGSSTP